MKASELAFGDWVMPLRKSVGKSCQVVSIDGGTNTCWIDSDEYSGLLPCSEIKPIPLTAEILEKNGFKDADIIVVGTRKFRWQSEDGRIEITIWLDDTMPMDIVKNVYYEDEVSYSLPFPWAVHILQHALRLCGIEKEIVLINERN